jgi:hypothetical protein
MTLSALPTEAFSLLGPVPIVLCDLAGDAEAGEGTFGLWSAVRRDIKIRADLTVIAALHTFYHEQTHCWLWDAGVRLSDEQEEAVCDAIATARVAEQLERK